MDFGWILGGFGSDFGRKTENFRRFFFEKKLCHFLNPGEKWSEKFFLAVILTVTFWPTLPQKILTHFQRGRYFRCIWPENHPKPSKINGKSMKINEN